MRTLLIAILLAAGDELNPEIKEALDEGCPKVARQHPQAPCQGIANLVEHRLQGIGVKIGRDGWNYCVMVCNGERQKKK